jgi:hypothetical protein
MMALKKSLMPIQDSALGQIPEIDGEKLGREEEQAQQRESAKARKWLQSGSAEKLAASSRTGPFRPRRREMGVASDNRNASGKAEKGKGKDLPR